MDTDHSSIFTTQIYQEIQRKENKLEGRVRIKVEKRLVYRRKREKKKEKDHLRLKKLYILNSSNNRLCTAITPDQDIEIAIESIVHRTTAGDSLERRITIFVRCLRKRNTETVGIDKVKLQTARGTIVGKTGWVVEQQTHRDRVRLASLCSRGLLQQRSLRILITASGEGNDRDIRTGVALDGEGRVAQTKQGPARVIACTKVAVGQHVCGGGACRTCSRRCR